MQPSDKDLQCDEARELFWPANDGELQVTDSLQLERHLAGCESCRQAFSRTGQFNQRLKRDTIDEEELALETEALWQKISHAMDARDARRYPGAGDAVAEISTARGRRGFLMAGSAAAAVAVTGVGLNLLNNESPDVVGEAVSDFLTFRAGGMTLNVVDKNPRELRQWFAERVAFDVAVSPVSPSGFDLVGGRLCSFLNRRLVFVYYQKGDAGVSVYMMTDDGLTTPKNNLVSAGNRKVSVNRVNGVATAAWHVDDLIFAAVSDLPQAELLEFVSAM